MSDIFEKPFIESTEIIEEIKEDIKKYGWEQRCFVCYRQVENHIIFTDYGRMSEEEGLAVDDIPVGEAVIVGTLGEALEAFEDQSWML